MVPLTLKDIPAAALQSHVWLPLLVNMLSFNIVIAYFTETYSMDIGWNT